MSPGESNKELEEILDGSALNKRGKVKYVIPEGMVDALAAWGMRQRLDELERNDYLFNKKLGSQQRLQDRKDEILASLGVDRGK